MSEPYITFANETLATMSKHILCATSPSFNFTLHQFNLLWIKLIVLLSTRSRQKYFNYCETCKSEHDQRTMTHFLKPYTQACDNCSYLQVANNTLLTILIPFNFRKLIPMKFFSLFCQHWLYDEWDVLYSWHVFGSACHVVCCKNKKPQTGGQTIFLELFFKHNFKCWYLSSENQIKYHFITYHDESNSKFLIKNYIILWYQNKLHKICLRICVCHRCCWERMGCQNSDDLYHSINQIALLLIFFYENEQKLYLHEWEWVFETKLGLINGKAMTKANAKLHFIDEKLVRKITKPIEMFG